MKDLKKRHSSLESTDPIFHREEPPIQTETLQGEDVSLRKVSPH